MCPDQVFGGGHGLRSSSALTELSVLLVRLCRSSSGLPWSPGTFLLLGHFSWGCSLPAGSGSCSGDGTALEQAPEMESAERTEMLPWHLPWQCQGLDLLGSLASPCPCQNPSCGYCSQAGETVLMEIPKLCSVPVRNPWWLFSLLLLCFNPFVAAVPSRAELCCSFGAGLGCQCWLWALEGKAAPRSSWESSRALPVGGCPAHNGLTWNWLCGEKWADWKLIL